MRIATMLGTPLGWPLAAALVAGTIAGSGPALAHPGAKRMLPRHAVVRAPVGSTVTEVNTGKGRLITLPRPMTDLFISDDGVADVQVRSPTQLYVFGKKAGETTVSATAKGGGVVWSSTVRVGNNYDSIGTMLHLAMPEAQVVATPMNGLVLLTGTVATPDDAAEAERLVQAYVGDGTKVLSRLKTATPLQVNLQVRFAEVSRSFVKNVGINLLTRDTSGGFLFGLASGRAPGTINVAPGTDPNISPTTGYTFGKGAERTSLGLAGHLLGLDVLSAIDLGETTGQVTTLANPNLTALSGETGTFLAGGEVPIPVSQGLGAVSVEYKQYGVSLSYTPTVLADGRISLRVRPEVSQLDYSNAVTLNGTRVPGLTSRRAETTVELGSGQSFVIGGLLQNNRNNSIDRTPFLSDVPILGALFRSNAFQRNETELMIVITPYLVKPVDATAVAMPFDGDKAPTDAARLLLGQTGEGDSGGKRPVPTFAPSPAPQPAIGAVAPVAPGPVAPSQSKKGASVAPGFSVN